MQADQHINRVYDTKHQCHYYPNGRRNRHRRDAVLTLESHDDDSSKDTHWQSGEERRQGHEHNKDDECCVDAVERSADTHLRDEDWLTMQRNANYNNEAY